VLQRTGSTGSGHGELAVGEGWRERMGGTAASGGEGARRDGMRRGAVGGGKKKNQTGTQEGVCNQWQRWVISFQLHEEVRNVHL
jgi:hypothetical protein